MKTEHIHHVLVDPFPGRRGRKSIAERNALSFKRAKAPGTRRRWRVGARHHGRARHTTLAQAELYIKEANWRRGGQRAVTQLNDRKANILSQTALERLRKVIKNGVKSE